MTLYRPSELKAFLHSIDAAPQKWLSQNFLIDGNIVRKITMLADIQHDETVIEIGPGPGVLTEAFLHQGSRVIAIEKDIKLSQALYRLQNPENRLTVFQEDALTWDYKNHLRFPSKIVANLPYHITTPILTRFLPLYHQLKSMTVMVQKEFADRMVANVGSPNYSSFSLFLQFYAETSFGFTVEPSCFYPAPSVKSAIVQLILKEPPKVDADAFFTLTRKAFQQRRKMIRSSLKQFYPLDRIDQGLTVIGKGMHVRPEELSLADFLELFKQING